LFELNSNSKKELILKRIFLAAITCLPLLAHADDVAKTIVTKGDSHGVTACQSCHGADGGGMDVAGFPRLAGLDEAYLERQMRNYRDGKRVNALMQPIAQGLSDKEVKYVAAYYSTLPVPAITPKGGDQAMLLKGQILALEGDWNHDIPPCFQCHGPDGKGIKPDFPAIIGQPASYISSQILAWKSGTRTNDPAGLMKAVSDKLSADQIKNVSAYLAMQPLTNGNKK
jgi:cytochrome c553